MSQKRVIDEGGAGGSGSKSPDDERPRVPAIREFMLEGLNMDAFQKLLSAIEPLVRRVVKEEIELALGKHLTCIKREREKQINHVAPRTLQLQFINKLSLPIYTGSKIESRDHSIINIALLDGLTGQIVASGPESFMKLEIVVLEGDFEGVEDDCSYEEFQNNIIREREGKRPLLMGNVLIELNDGIGVLGELVFTDNSSWTRSRKFRLGARIMDGFFNGVRVREAKTEAFIVKDHRGELYKKHRPPFLTDEVWRLEKIGKDGAFHKRLSNANVNTVKDFLFLLFKDDAKLRNILGSGMSTKMWELTIEHARTCMLDNQVHLYYPNTESKTGVVFNILGEVLGLLSEQMYLAYDNFSNDQKSQTQQLAKDAFEHWGEVISCDFGTIIGGRAYEPPNSFPSEQPAIQDIYDGLNVTSATVGFAQTLTSLETSVRFKRGLDASPLQAVWGADSDFNSDDLSSFSHDRRKKSRELLKDYNPSTFNDAGCIFSEDTFQFFDHDEPLLSQGLGGVVDSPADLGTAVTGFLAMTSRSTGARPCKAYVCWKTLISVLRWRFSIKRIVALKKSLIR